MTFQRKRQFFCFSIRYRLVFLSQQVHKLAKMVNLYKITENTLEYLNSKADKVSTGIKDVTFVGVNKSDDAYYTLQGVKVASPLTAGIYVHNHKKVVVR